MKVILQDDPEWVTARLGRATASRMADITARTKTGWGASRTNYAAELLVERLTGTQAPSFMNDAMRWGVEKEPEARMAYEFIRDCDVAPGGFVLHPKIEMSGASPDGFVGDEGLVEIKCPNTATHLDTLLGKSIDGKYVAQIQWQLDATERKWCDFVSFDPRLPDAMRLFVSRVKRDDTMIAALRKDVIEFLAEIAERETALRKKYLIEPTNLLMAG